MGYLRCLVCSVALLACRGADPTEDCDDRVSELMVFLRAMDHTGNLVDDEDAPGIELAAHPGAHVYTGAWPPALVVTPGKRRWLRAAFDRDPHVAALAIDQRVPWSEVDAALDELWRTGHDHVLLVFSAPSPVHPPPRVPFDDELDRTLRLHTRVEAFQRAVTQLTARCTPIIEGYRNIWHDESASPTDNMLRETGEGLRACGCRADLPAMRAMLWRFAGNPHPQRVVELDLPSTFPALPKATPWSIASGAL